MQSSHYSDLIKNRYDGPRMIQLSDKQLNGLGKKPLVVTVSSLQDQLRSLQSQLNQANAQLSDNNRQIELITEQIRM